MGKYDEEVKKEFNNLFCFEILNDENEYIEKIMTNYELIRKYFFSNAMAFYDKKELDKNFEISGLNGIQINDILKKISQYTLGLITLLSGKDSKKIKDEALQLFLIKNSFYNDAWHKNGSFGCFYDLNRKIVRIKGFDNINDQYFQIKDTLYDLLNYSILLKIAINNIPIFIC